MKSMTAFVILVCLAEAFHNQRNKILQRKELIPAKVEEIIAPRVVNGQRARPNQFPFMAGLQFYKVDGGSNFCGGALISHIWIVTAAHCLIGHISVSVYLGSNEHVLAPVEFEVTSRNMISHPLYNEITKNNDIALISIPSVAFSSKIQPISLPRIGFNLNFGSLVEAPGWGNIATHGDMSKDLLYISVKVISNSHCSKFYQNLSDTIVCTNSIGKGVCYGDSGGPLVLESSNVLVGITSFFHHDGCSTGTPDGFTRITSYLNWLHSRTGIQV